MFMSLRKGQKAPLFKLDSTGGEFNLENQKGKYTVLYFYPKDFTYGCTKEACAFRDEFENFRDLNIDVFGINKDSIATHNRFKKEHRLPFELLSDINLDIAKKYNAVVPFIGLVKRITYLIDPDLKIAGVFESMTKFDKHVKRILEMQ